jgi:hypothetical protein
MLSRSLVDDRVISDWLVNLNGSIGYYGLFSTSDGGHIEQGRGRGGRKERMSKGGRRPRALLARAATMGDLTNYPPFQLPIHTPRD